MSNSDTEVLLKICACVCVRVCVQEALLIVRENMYIYFSCSFTSPVRWLWFCPGSYSGLTWILEVRWEEKFGQSKAIRLKKSGPNTNCRMLGSRPKISFGERGKRATLKREICHEVPNLSPAKHAENYICCWLPGFQIFLGFRRTHPSLWSLLDSCMLRIEQKSLVLRIPSTCFPLAIKTLSHRISPVEIGTDWLSFRSAWQCC